MRGVDQAIAAWQIRPADAHVLLLLDFDGTLADFEANPSKVRLPPGRQELLQVLAADPSFTVAIVSGRRIADMRERTAIGHRVFYAGLHGLEIEGPGVKFVHHAAAVASPTIGVLEKQAREAVRELSGVVIEDKGLSVVLHVRGASKSDRLHARTRFQALAAPYLSDGLLRVQPGDEMVELLPNIDWTKGDAVTYLQRHIEAERKHRVWPIYIGDDQTDEDAFEAIGDAGLTIAVSNRPAGASIRLPDPAAVETFLRALLATN